MSAPARRVPRRLKEIHFMFPCCKYSSITSGKSPCNGSSPAQNTHENAQTKISSFRVKAQTRRKTAGAKSKKETFIPKENPDGENEQKPTDYWGIHCVWLPRRGEKQNRCRQQRRAERIDPDTPPRVSPSRKR